MGQKITEKGKLMSSFPLDPSLSCCILAAEKFTCTEEMISVVALLSVDSIIYIPPNQRDKGKAILNKFSSNEGDPITLLRLYRAYKKSKENIELCRDYFIRTRAMK